MPNSNREFAAGTLLIGGAVAGIVVMALHPTAHGLMNAESGPHLTRVNVMVHGLALAATPLSFLGLLGLWRRLAPSDVATAGLVLYGWGCVAVLSAAVASGFVAPGVIARLAAVAGIFGAVVSALILLLFFAGHLKLDVHGFGIVIFAQAAWLVLVGILLCRGSGVGTSQADLSRASSG